MGEVQRGFTNDLQPEMGPQETEICQNRTGTFGGFPEHCALRTWSILTLAMPYVKTEQIQNVARF